MLQSSLKFLARLALHVQVLRRDGAVVEESREADLAVDLVHAVSIGFGRARRSEQDILSTCQQAFGGAWLRYCLPFPRETVSSSPGRRTRRKRRQGR